MWFCVEESSKKRKKGETATLFPPQTGSDWRSFNRFQLAAEVVRKRKRNRLLVSYYYEK
jgi:hypothetical protein